MRPAAAAASAAAAISGGGSSIFGAAGAIHLPEIKFMACPSCVGVYIYNPSTDEPESPVPQYRCGGGCLRHRSYQPGGCFESKK